MLKENKLHFDTYEESAEWFGENDMADYEDKYEEGVPDDEMPELTKEDFARAKPNRFAKGIFRIDDDILPYFKSEREINEALRLVVRLSELVSHK